MDTMIINSSQIKKIVLEANMYKPYNEKNYPQALNEISSIHVQRVRF